MLYKRLISQMQLINALIPQNLGSGNHFYENMYKIKKDMTLLITDTENRQIMKVI